MATLTTTSPPSSSTADSCSINGKGKGCTRCGEDDHDFEDPDFFDDLPLSANNRTARSLFRRGQRNIAFKCEDDFDFTTKLEVPAYPSFNDRTKTTVAVKVTDYYAAADPTNCLNHQITHETAIPAHITGTPKPLYQMEHIYEANWVARFLRDLTESSGLGCKDVKRIFFDTPTNDPLASNWAQALMESLGSAINQDDLVFLWDDINRAKAVIFGPGDIIAKDRWAASEWYNGKGTTTIHDASWRVNKIATIGRAMDYMAQPAVGTKLLLTVSRIERTLKTLNAKLSGPDLAMAGNLALHHRNWFNRTMAERNVFAAGEMSRWAKDASATFVGETPKEVAASVTERLDKWESTTSFLWALQTGRPKAFDPVGGVVGWYEW
jgi:hypothetical protein